MLIQRCFVTEMEGMERMGNPPRDPEGKLTSGHLVDSFYLPLALAMDRRRRRRFKPGESQITRGYRIISF